MLRISTLGLLALVAGSATASAQVAPHASWTVLPWGNGHGAGAYDTSQSKMTSLREHVFQRTQAAATRELLFDGYPGLRVGGQNLWLNTLPATASYDAQRGIVEVAQSWQGVTVTAHLWSPFGVDAALTAEVFEVTNTTAAPLTDAALFTLDNLHVGSGDGTIGEHITWVDDAYEERGDAGLVLHRPSPLPLAHAASPQNPYATVMAGNRLTNVDDSGVMNDAVAGFEWDLTGLAPGATQQVMLVLADRPDGDRAALDTALASIGTDPAAALAAARADWDAFFARAQVPMGLSTDELAVYRQQLAVLRMGQVTEGPGTGQLVASLPTGEWDIAWVRDQSYATSALVHAGLAAEAKAALQFWWTASAGQWVCCDSTGAPWVGTSYAPSVVRYTGDGVEESDTNDNGPNIEFDGFGLALAVTDEYVAATGDTALVSANADAIFARTADVLVDLVETSGPTAGLVRADSSIWEEHWYNGGKKHFAYTQAAAVRGLRAAADLADRLGRSADAVRYRTAAGQLTGAFAAKFVAGTVLRGNLEETSTLDAAAIEAFNWDVVPATTNIATGTLDAFKAGLWNGDVGHGYHRNDDGGDYDTREWIMIDLRIATAARRAGRAADADELIAWVTAQSRLNFDLVPENYDKTTGDYSGAIPMVGFGAGAYVNALWERGAFSNPTGGDAGIGGDAGTFEPTPASCACRGSDPGGAVLLVVVVFALRRRRS